MWSFKEDIATYDNGSFVMIIKIKLVEFNDEDEKRFDVGFTEVHITQFAFDEKFVSRIMAQLGEDMLEYGIDNFHVYRHCEVCDELFLKTSKNKTICSGKCRTRKSRGEK